MDPPSACKTQHTRTEIHHFLFPTSFFSWRTMVARTYLSKTEILELHEYVLFDFLTILFHTLYLIILYSFYFHNDSYIHYHSSYLHSYLLKLGLIQQCNRLPASNQDPLQCIHSTTNWIISLKIISIFIISFKIFSNST